MNIVGFWLGSAPLGFVRFDKLQLCERCDGSVSEYICDRRTHFEGLRQGGLRDIVRGISALIENAS